VSQYFYPRNYRFDSHSLKHFEMGVDHGHNSDTVNLTTVDFDAILNQSLVDVRSMLNI